MAEVMERRRRQSIVEKLVDAIPMPLLAGAALINGEWKPVDQISFWFNDEDGELRSIRFVVPTLTSQGGHDPRVLAALPKYGEAPGAPPVPA